jgi:peptide deformylase
MALHEIIGTDNPILRRKGKKIQKITPHIQHVIDDMVETMRAAPGIGLAAPQVAQSLRLFVAELEEDPNLPGSGKLYTVLNPEYIHQSEELITGVEGCLSVPGWAGEVERHAQVVIKGLDRHGRKIKLEAEGWLARVFQHEMDHLDGVLFTDRISDPAKVWPVEAGEEEQAEIRAERKRRRALVV